ncbi:MAG: ion transporter, partial [Bacteroidales bacterium]
QFLSALVMLIGYTIIAVPTGIVTASVMKNATTQTREQEISCRNCGRTVPDKRAFYCPYCGGALDENQQVQIRK